MHHDPQCLPDSNPIGVNYECWRAALFNRTPEILSNPTGRFQTVKELLMASRQADPKHSDYATRIDAARDQRNALLRKIEMRRERLLRGEGRPTMNEFAQCDRDTQRVREDFEKQRGELALKLVRSTSPLVWWDERWFLDAITEWWGTGQPKSQAAVYLRKVTETMGRRPLVTALHALKRKWKFNSEDPSDALAKLYHLEGVCTRLKDLRKRYKEQELVGLLVTWIHSGTRHPDDPIDIQPKELEGFERDFNALRAAFGAPIKKVGQGFRIAFPSEEGESEGRTAISAFLEEKVPKYGPIRLAAILTSKWYGIPIRKLERLAAQHRP